MPILARDFKSLVSTDSTTQAKSKGFGELVRIPVPVRSPLYQECPNLSIFIPPFATVGLSVHREWQ